ncbi:MAG: M15 family metallopeptidase [Clostridia bacterium]|nr:M15 family metallopeptidase [Clostridia bacterium]
MMIKVKNIEEFEKAFETLSDGGEILLTAPVTVRETRLAPHRGKITVSGQKLVFDTPVCLTLGGKTEFTDVTIDVKTSGVIAADFHPLTFGEKVVVESDLSEEMNGLYLIGGAYRDESRATYTADPEIAVFSGKISRLVAFSAYCAGSLHTGKATLTVGGDAYVRYAVCGGMGEDITAGGASLTLKDSAVIETLMPGGSRKDDSLTGDFDLFVGGGDLYCFDHTGLTTVKGRRNLLYTPQNAPAGLVFLAKLARFDSIRSTCDLAGHAFGEPMDNPFGKGTKIHVCKNCGYTEQIGAAADAACDGVVFVADGGFGNGALPTAPLGDYAKAVEALGDAGGILVLVGKCTLPVNMTDRFEKVADAYQEARHGGRIIVTSLYGGVDYRDRGAELVFSHDMDYRMSGPVTFENMTFAAEKGTAHNRVIARYNPLLVGDGVKTPEDPDYKLDLVGGYLGFRYTDLDGYKIENEFEEIVNAYRPLPPDFSFDDLTPIGISPRFTLRKEAAEAFDRMYADMKKEGLKMPYISDASRTYARQYALFTSYIGRLRRRYGYDFETARKVVLRSCGMPLCSEHHRGVAVDMYDADLTQFGGKKHHYYNLTPEWAWVCENGAKYGIILRYPAAKTHVSGTIYEAWHFSYVGKTAAAVIKVTGYAMEEYVGAKLGLFHQNSSVTVRSGRFDRITSLSLDVDHLQFTGNHFLSVSDAVVCREKSGLNM